MIVHDIKMHDISTGIEHIGHFLTQAGKVSRQDGGCYLVIGHAVVLTNIFCPQARGCIKMKRELYPNDR